MNNDAEIIHDYIQALIAAGINVPLMVQAAIERLANKPLGN